MRYLLRIGISIIGLLLLVASFAWASPLGDPRTTAAARQEFKFPGNDALTVVKTPGNESSGEWVEIDGQARPFRLAPDSADAPLPGPSGDVQADVINCNLVPTHRVNPYGSVKMGYYAAIWCSQPVTGTLSVWLEHVYPENTNWTEISGTRKTRSCSAGPSGCATAIYQFRTDGCACTRKIIVRANFVTSSGSISIQYAEDPWWAYNNKGYPYPIYEAPWGILGFPAGPYSPSIARASIKAQTESMYSSQGWAFPPSPYDAHHIKPAYFNGPNDGYSNGVLLERTVHQQQFHGWWCKFDPPTADPPASCTFDPSE